MADNLDKYLPEFDEEESREKLSTFERHDLIDMLIRAYKEKRVLAKMLDEQFRKLDNVRSALDQPSQLANSPDIPSADDLRRMNENDCPIPQRLAATVPKVSHRHTEPSC